jgi:hypothetical protein
MEMHKIYVHLDGNRVVDGVPSEDEDAVVAEWVAGHVEQRNVQGRKFYMCMHV